MNYKSCEQTESYYGSISSQGSKEGIFILYSAQEDSCKQTFEEKQDLALFQTPP